MASLEYQPYITGILGAEPTAGPGEELGPAQGNGALPPSPETESLLAFRRPNELQDFVGVLGTFNVVV